MSNTGPLYIRAAEAFDQPFEGDLFQRRELAERLTGYVDRLPDGAVIAIDGAWGEGKSWFGRHWCSSLTSDRTTAYLDAFATDYMDDPFLAICAEVLKVIREKNGPLEASLRDAGGRVARALIPVAAKITLALGGRALLGTANLGEEIQSALEAADDKASDALEKLLSKHLAAYEEEGKSVAGFKEKLEEFTSQLSKPFVIFVDELDRCRPDYAVRTIERIKHFFGVKGLVFVLLINKPQLVAAVKGLYGEHVDAEAYLRKFVQFSLTLPKRRGEVDDNEQFCLHRLYGLGFPGTEAATTFSSVLGALATGLGLSLRDVELGTVYFAMAQPIGRSSAVLAWAVALKLSRPDIFAGILRGEARAHERALELIVELKIEKISWMTGALIDLHKHGAAGFLPDAQVHPRTRELLVSWGGHRPQALFNRVFASIDLAITQ